MASVVVPAHNEERVIGRLLEALTRDRTPGELEIVVVCNGCTDRTAEIAREAGGRADVRVEEIPEASKFLALRRGDEIARTLPRLYVDADVVLDGGSVCALARAVGRPGVLAAAPARDLDLSRSSGVVRAYHRVWERLPAVRSGLYGRGVLAVSAGGFERIRERPNVLGDDLFLHHAFRDTERIVVPQARATVTAPRTVGALLARRTRAALGNAQFAERRQESTDTTHSSLLEVLQVARREPRLAPAIVVFVAVTLAARLRARSLRKQGDLSWLRDDTSRT